MRRVSEVDYEVNMPERKVESEVYHVNLLKAWKSRKQVVSVAEELGPSGAEAIKPAGDIQVGEEIEPKQKERYTEGVPENLLKEAGEDHYGRT